jgi:uncharacterized cupredoxin-like copper-binding protein
MRIWLLATLLMFPPPLAAETIPTVRVEMTEFRFRPSGIRLPVNRPVRLILTNRGQLAHQLDAPVLRRVPVVIYDDSLHVETGGVDIVRLDPGKTATLDLFLRTIGRFPFACTIEGHKEAGMVGTLEVR